MLPPILLIESATSKLRRDERSHNHSGIVKKGASHQIHHHHHCATSTAMRPPPSFEFCIGLHRPTTTLSTSFTPLIGSRVNEDYVFIHGRRSGSRGQWWKVLGSGGSG
ncbi:hypothetical protein PIB30_001654 [Stylosanthes scabra]|uniref:Uncharacterized protein n=1 Tax=Stylosanthes scabra TaxID=79078 RepID=A0ABU6T3R0_9FABA|nr:hypothetical protein [Stylosanthes scabra]